MGIPAAIAAVFEFLSQIWEYMSGRKKRELVKRRTQLEEDSRTAQIKGDVNELRRIRHDLEDVDSELSHYT